MKINEKRPIQNMGAVVVLWRSAYSPSVKKQVRIPRTTPTLYSIMQPILITYLLFECKKSECKQKEAGVGPCKLGQVQHKISKFFFPSFLKHSKLISIKTILYDLIFIYLFLIGAISYMELGCMMPRVITCFSFVHSITLVSKIL